MNWRVDIWKLCTKLIPYFLRKGGTNLQWVTDGGLAWVTAGGQFWGTSGNSRHADWVQSLLRPVQDLAITFYDYTVNVYYRLSFTGQTIYVEHLLNDCFDNDLRGIYIEDDAIIIPDFLYNTADNQDPYYVYNDSEGEDTFLYNQADYYTANAFIVYVPSYITLDALTIARIRAKVNMLRQAGTQFTIENY